MIFVNKVLFYNVILHVHKIFWELQVRTSTHLYHPWMLICMMYMMQAYVSIIRFLPEVFP